MKKERPDNNLVSVLVHRTKLHWIITFVTLGLTIMSLIVASSSFVYHVWLIERGVVWGKARAVPVIGSVIRIRNLHSGCGFEVPVTVWNSGTAPLEVGNMFLYVSLTNGDRKSLRATACCLSVTDSWSVYTPFMLQPGATWSGVVRFGEREREDLVDQMNTLNANILTAAADAYLADPEKNKLSNLVYQLPPEAYREVCNRLSQNITWLRRGTYRALLKICPRSDEKNPILQGAYTFRVTDPMLKHLESQAHGYSYVTLSGDPAVLPSVHAILRKLTDGDSDALANEAHSVDPNF